MAQLLKSYGIPMKIINAIMILYIYTKLMIRSPDSDTEYFDINACRCSTGGYSGTIIIYYYTRLRIKNIY